MGTAKMLARLRCIRGAPRVINRGCAANGKMWAVPAVDQIGELPRTGQNRSGPFFTGDAEYPPKLSPLPNSGGVAEALDSLAERTPCKLAMVVEEEGVSWSFLELKGHTDALARGLQELGVKDQVSVNGEDSSSVVSVLATQKNWHQVDSGQGSACWFHRD